jgi:hypothetical protein
MKLSELADKALELRDQRLRNKKPFYTWTDTQWTPDPDPVVRWGALTKTEMHRIKTAARNELAKRLPANIVNKIAPPPKIKLAEPEVNVRGWNIGDILVSNGGYFYYITDKKGKKSFKTVKLPMGPRRAEVKYIDPSNRQMYELTAHKGPHYRIPTAGNIKYNQTPWQSSKLLSGMKKWDGRPFVSRPRLITSHLHDEMIRKASQVPNAEAARKLVLREIEKM